jgi:outer membrane protein TolC
MGRCAILLVIGVVALGFLGPVHPIRADVGLQSDTLRLSLEEAVARALRESEEIATARTAMAQADAQVVQATASALPQLSSSLTYNRAIRSIFDQAQGPPPVSDSLIPPAFDPDKSPHERFDLLSQLMVQDFMSALFGGLPFGRKNTYIATLTLTQPVYVGGKVGAALKVAEHYRAAARDQLAETEEDITLQVRSAYLTAGLAQRLVDIAVESRRLAGEHLSQVESFFEAGTAAEFDLLRARVDLENRDPIVVQAQNSATLALLDLKRLVNVPAEQQLRLTSEMDPTVVEVDKPALRRMVMERPALQAAAEAVGMQEQAVKIARGNRLPTVTFLGTMGFQSFPDNPLPPGFDQWRKDWSAALSISLPIFDGFRTRGEIDMAQADLKTAELQADQLREALSLQLAGALAEYEAARSQIRARRETVGMAERALELAEVRFASGMSTQLEVSDAALLLDQARVNEVQSLYDYVRALATLERLSGGKMELIGVGS